MILDKKWNKINRMCEACVLFAQGKLTLEQVHRRIRGDQRSKLVLSYPDVELGFQLYALSCDFYSWLGYQDDIIERRICEIADYLNMPSSKTAKKTTLKLVVH